MKEITKIDHYSSFKTCTCNLPFFCWRRTFVLTSKLKDFRSSWSKFQWWWWWRLREKKQPFCLPISFKWFITLLYKLNVTVFLCVFVGYKHMVFKSGHQLCLFRLLQGAQSVQCNTLTQLFFLLQDKCKWSAEFCNDYCFLSRGTHSSMMYFLNTRCHVYFVSFKMIMQWTCARFKTLKSISGRRLTW